MKLALSVPSTAEILSSVRHTVLDWLAGAGFRGEGAHDVLVVVSELVTNGVIHDGGDDIELYLAKDDKGILSKSSPLARDPLVKLVSFAAPLACLRAAGASSLSTPSPTCYPSRTTADGTTSYAILRSSSSRGPFCRFS